MDTKEDVVRIKANMRHTKQVTEKNKTVTGRERTVSYDSAEKRRGYNR